MILKDECCCENMFDAICAVGIVPINVERIENNKLFFGLRFVDLSPDSIVFEDGFEDDNGDDSIQFCPFCGKKVSIFKGERSGRWKKRKTLCGSFLAWFNNEGKAPTRMFEYDHRNNQFYLHKRKGFGDGYIPVKYCIYCGEPFSEMISKHGIPEFIKNSLRTDDWWKQRGL
jgi:hypothetical protein